MKLIKLNLQNTNIKCTRSIYRRRYGFMFVFSFFLYLTSNFYAIKSIILLIKNTENRLCTHRFIINRVM